MSDHAFDTAIVGAGAIGMAVAAALSDRGQSVLVLEAGDRIGEATTARSSEVIHAGLYYPTGSRKHRFCVAGRRMLYAFLDRTGVDYSKCGKLVVATTAAEEEKLADIHRMGLANGVEGLRPLSRRETAALEPEVTATAALFSRETGVFDSHGFLLRLLGILEGRGGVLALRTPFVGAAGGKGGFEIVTGGDDPTTLRTRRLVNAAGLWAPQLAARVEGMPGDVIPRQRLAKGCYFRLAGRSPFSHLIYPVPVDGGLGVHATLDLGGATRFGPDVEWLSADADPNGIDYAVDADRVVDFEAAIRRYWPGLPPGRLEPDYSGVRPKLRGPGEGFSDFDLQTAEVHGVPGLVNVFGMESPGLTSSLAVGEAVADLLEEA